MWARPQMRPSRVFVVHEKYRRPSLGVAGRDSLHLHRGVSARESGGGLDVTDDCAGDLSILGSSFGVYLGIQAPPAFGIRLAPIRWDRHSHPRRDDLEDVAVELGMGDRHTGGDQHVLAELLA